MDFPRTLGNRRDAMHSMGREKGDQGAALLGGSHGLGVIHELQRTALIEAGFGQLQGERQLPLDGGTL